jgi:hypothetical protein
MATPPVLVAPLTLTVYVIPAVSELDGVNVSVVPAPFRVVLPVTALPLESVRARVADPDWIAVLNVTFRLDETGTLVAPPDGYAAETTGALFVGS